MDFISAVTHPTVLALIQALASIGLAAARYFRINIAIVIVFLVVSLIVTIADFVVKKVLKRKLIIATLEQILQECVSKVEERQERQGKRSLRANIMEWNESSKCLKIIAYYNMESAPDRTAVFARGQGCCGEAFDSGQIVVGDLSNIYKSDWESTRREHSSPPWGISREHFEMNPNLRSIISIPLVVGQKTIGVLNLDDTINVTDALFNDRDLQQLIGAYVFFINKVIKGGTRFGRL